MEADKAKQAAEIGELIMLKAQVCRSVFFRAQQPAAPSSKYWSALVASEPIRSPLRVPIIKLPDVPSRSTGESALGRRLTRQAKAAAAAAAASDRQHTARAALARPASLRSLG